jgi:hypothetical protein
MLQTKFIAPCRFEINTSYRVHLSQPVIEILIFFRFFQIFANFDALDASNGRNSVIYGPIREILAVLQRARRGESRRGVRRATPLTQSVKEFTCESADGFFSHIPYYGPGSTRSYVDNSVVYEDFSEPFQQSMHADSG